MEDKDTTEPTRPTVPVSRPVMDVQRPTARPQPTTVGAPTSESPAEPESEATPPAEPTTPPAETSVESPAAKPSFDIAAALAEADKTPGAATTPDAAAASEAHSKADHLLAAHAKTGHKPIVPIIIAVIVAIALGAVTVFAYMKTKNDTRGGGDTHTTAPTAETQDSSGATPQDVDDASKAVDGAAGTNDTADLPETDLSDNNLGM